MKITFQTKNTSYRTAVPAQRKYTPASGKTKGDYDTVNISKSRVSQGSDESFARILARKTAAQLSDGASQERVQELKSSIAEGVYQPDSQMIAGRLLGLG